MQLPPLLSLVAAASAWAAEAAVMAGQYQRTQTYMGEDFFSKFNFFDKPDPTRGYVQYVSRNEAHTEGLVNATADRVYIGVDMKKRLDKHSKTGRRSVRIHSKNVYTGGLFVIKVDHLPTGCGTWPAFWMYGEDPDHPWPAWGEYDIIEGEHKTQQVMTSLHTAKHCDQSGVVAGRDFSRTWRQGRKGIAADNCSVTAEDQLHNQGCSQNGPAGSMGAAFNARGGGTYAGEWDPVARHIRTWFWPRGSEPPDLVALKPRPYSWGTPYSFFSLDPRRCSQQHFVDMRLIFDMTFCGELGGPTWQRECPEEAEHMTCEEFVANHPEKLTEAFWSIGVLDVYLRKFGPPPPRPPTTLVSTTTTQRPTTSTSTTTTSTTTIPIGPTTPRLVEPVAAATTTSRLPMKTCHNNSSPSCVVSALSPDGEERGAGVLPGFLAPAAAATVAKPSTHPRPATSGGTGDGRNGSAATGARLGTTLQPSLASGTSGPGGFPPAPTLAATTVTPKPAPGVGDSSNRSGAGRPGPLAVSMHTPMPLSGGRDRHGVAGEDAAADSAEAAAAAEGQRRLLWPAALGGILGAAVVGSFLFVLWPKVRELQVMNLNTGKNSLFDPNRGSSGRRLVAIYELALPVEMPYDTGSHYSWQDPGGGEPREGSWVGGREAHRQASDDGGAAVPATVKRPKADAAAAPSTHGEGAAGHVPAPPASAPAGTGAAGAAQARPDRGGSVSSWARRSDKRHSAAI